MAKNDSSDNYVSANSTTGGLGGTTQDLTTGLIYGPDGEAIVPDIDVPDGTEIVQTDQIGAWRRTVFSNGAVEVIQNKPATRGDGSIVTPVPLPGESEDVAGTGQDEAYKPKVAPGTKK